MFQNIMNSTNSIKKVSELWKDEKKYRWWIISFSFALLILFALHLGLIIASYIHKNDLILYFQNFFDDPKDADNYFISFISPNFIMTFAWLLCFLFFVFSIFKCYKMKSFEKLDSISSFFIGFQVFFIFYSLFWTFFLRGSDFSVISGNIIMILDFSLKFLIIPIWLILSREVKKIKRTFFIAKRQEELQAFYEANGQQMGMNPNEFQNASYSPFGFPFQRKNSEAPGNNSQSQIDTNKENINPKDEKKTQRYLKLQLMTVSQLRKLADKLSISGNKEMKKPELINIILMVSQSFENTKNSKDTIEENEIDNNENNDSKSVEIDIDVDKK